MRRLEDKVALVTAGGSGMGRAACERMAAEGAHVVVTDLDEGAAAAVRDGIVEAGGSAHALGCDVADMDRLKAIFAHVEGEHGHLDVLFSHAGIPGKDGLEISDEQWQQAVDVNLKSAFYGAAFAEPLMRRAGGGSMIFTSSVSGLVGSEFSPLYSMVKGGVVLLAKSLAVRLGPENIRANAICPAMIDTPMLPEFWSRSDASKVEETKQRYSAGLPMRRTASPEEVGSVVAFLASADSAFVTGAAIPVDGGFVAR